jgi:hypothetical protein
MSTSLIRGLAATALGVSAVLAGTGTASAACYGTQNTVTVCTADAVVYQDCVYTGTGPCKPVSLVGPVCVYGTVLRDAYYTTTFC